MKSCGVRVSFSPSYYTGVSAVSVVKIINTHPRMSLCYFIDISRAVLVQLDMMSRALLCDINRH
jgi:hypothetical protein